MRPGGEIAPAVRRAIKAECQRLHPEAADTCTQAVVQKVTSEIGKFCDKNASTQGIGSPLCQKRLGSLVWLNWRHLERQLNRKMRRLGEVLIGPEPLEASNGTTHRSLATLIQFEARDFRPPPPPPPTPPSPAQNVSAPGQQTAEEKNVWEQPFGLLHSFTHIDEWVPLQTRVTFIKDSAPTQKTIDWYYWLKRNPDGSFTLYWSTVQKTDPPGDNDPQVIFQLVDGHIPNNLKLIYSESTGLRPALK